MAYFNNPAIMDAIEKLGHSDHEVVVVGQDTGAGGWIKGEFPAEYFDVGITEQNQIGVAAGLAHVGKLASPAGRPKVRAGEPDCDR